jgi:hypothetical protein
VGSLDGGDPVFVTAMEATPVYVAPGWLMSIRRGVLFALAFDPATFRTSGDPVSLGDEPTLVTDPAISYTAAHAVSVADDGTLAFFSTPAVDTAARWLDTQGRAIGTVAIPPGQYSEVAIGPDGTRAVLIRSVSTTESSLWLADLIRGHASQLSIGGGRNDAPVWSPDGARVLFASDRDGPQDLFIKSITDPSPEQPFYRDSVLFKNADAWSRDEQWIVVRTFDMKTQQDLVLIPATGQGKPVPYVIGPYRDHFGRPSPDGKWLAYVSEDSGRGELWVQSFPTPGRRTQVSSTGALLSWWTPDSRHLYFADGNLSSLWSVDLTLGLTIDVGTPRRIAMLPPDVIAIDATPDRQKFLVLLPERTGTGSITLVQHWQSAVLARK